MRLSSPFILSALIALFLAAPMAHADPVTGQLCAAEAANMEDVAKGRDAGTPEAAARADQNGDIENKIVSLIYRSPRSSPARIKAAVLKVCTETDAFAHGVDVPNDAGVDKIDASIIRAIRIQLTQH
jgi:hypothetical protein